MIRANTKVPVASFRISTKTICSKTITTEQGSGILVNTHVSGVLPIKIK